MSTNRPSAARAVAVSLCFGVLSTPLSAQVEVRGASITELQEAMTRGSATSAQITTAYLARIRAYDQAGPRLNSMIWLNPDALADAQALDRERAERGPRGPLHGIPIILKDNYDTDDMPTSAGTLALATSVPADDAFQVARLREAGAVIIGKANMHELARGITTIGSLGGQSRNPYDPRRNPGGSSGGTGAAIAASFAAVGWGSDTCGSIRIPSAQNNLVGLRPTKGLSSIDGIIPLSHTQDVGGPLARSVRDLALALDATVGPDPADPATAVLEGRELPGFVDALDADALEGARFGLLDGLFGDAPEEAASARIVREALGEMVELGADTLTVEIPNLESLLSDSGVIGMEFKWDLIDYLAAARDAPVSSANDMLDLGLVHQALVPALRRSDPEERETEEYLRALATRDTLRDAIEGALRRYQVDALVFPTIRTIPAIIGDPQRGSGCSVSAHSGLPAISVPAGFTETGLPIGMEMLGRSFDDARLVAIAYAFEQAVDHRREPESTPALVDGRAPPPRVASIRASGRGYEPARSSGTELHGTVSLDLPGTALAFDLTVAGTPPSDVLAVVLRHPDDEDRWLVARRLSGPGVAAVRGGVRLDPGLLTHLRAGQVVVEVFTKAHPFGAARAELPFGG